MYCKNADDKGKCLCTEKGCTLSKDDKGFCELGDLEEYIGTSYKARENLCSQIIWPFNPDQEGDD